MNTNISTTLDVLRLAAQTVPGTTVQLARGTLSLPDGREVFTVNELDRSGALLTKGRLHIVADKHGLHAVPIGTELHDQIAARCGSTALASN